MTDWIGETFTSDAGWSHLERLVDIGNRMAGSEGERRAAEATRDALGEYARDARLAEFPVQGWTRERSAVRAGDTVQECIALPRSPAASASGTFVDAGHGLPRDFEETDLDGAVVMARSDVPNWYDRYLHRREKYQRAVEAGAAAFVYRNHVEGCLPPTGSVSGPDSPIGDIPAVGVSAEVGARLARRFEGDTVTVEVEADIAEASSQNVHAVLGPDPDPTSDADPDPTSDADPDPTSDADPGSGTEVLVTSHVDAHDIAEGAGDNGAGTAMVVELARALSAREAELDSRVHFVCFGAEEVGLVGSEHLADRTTLADVTAVVNNDGVVRGRTLSATTNGFEELSEVVSRVRDRFDHPIETSPKPGPHSDHWPFVRRGVPGYHVTSRTDESGRGWGHTVADTLDKLESRTLRESAVLLTELVVELASDDVTVPHTEPEAVAEMLEAEDLAEGLKLTGDWPFE